MFDQSEFEMARREVVEFVHRVRIVNSEMIPDHWINDEEAYEMYDEALVDACDRGLICFAYGEWPMGAGVGDYMTPAMFNNLVSLGLIFRPKREDGEWVDEELWVFTEWSNSIHAMQHGTLLDDPTHAMNEALRDARRAGWTIDRMLFDADGTKGYIMQHPRAWMCEFVTEPAQVRIKVYLAGRKIKGEVA